jgi:hypothetical protein
MKIEFIDGAGKRLTDGSAIALAALAVIPSIMAVIPETGQMTVRDMIMVAVAALGWIFKFVRVTL